MATRWCSILVLTCALSASALAQSGTPEEELGFAEKLFEDGLYPIAAVQFRTFAERFPRHPQAPRALYRAAEALLASAEPGQALEVLKNLEISYPRSDWGDKALARMADSHLALPDTLAAIGDLERLTYLYPSSPLVPDALLRAAELHLGIGRPDMAQRRLGDLIDNYPDRPQRGAAFVLLGKALLQIGDLRAALAQFEKAMATTGSAEVGSAAALLKAEVLEDLGQVDEAEMVYQALITKARDSRQAVEARLRLGEIARRRGDVAKAEEYFQQVQVDSLEAAEAANLALWLGQMQMDRGAYAAALQNFEAGLKRRPMGVVAARLGFAAAAAAERLQDLNAALLHYKRVAGDTLLTGALSQWRARARLETARLHVLRGQPHQALAEIAKVIQEFPESEWAEQARFARGRLLAESLQDPSQAVRVFSRFIEDFPRNPAVDEAQFLIAQCYERMHQLDLALEEYRRYLRLYPGADRVSEARERVQILANLVADRWQARLAEVLDTLPEVAQGSDGRHLSYELGLLFFDLRDFRQAIRYLKQSLAAGYDLQNGPQALYYLGRSYHGLAQQQVLLGNGADWDRLVDSARVALSYVKEHFTDTEAAAEASYLLLRWELRNTANPEGRRLLLEAALEEWNRKYAQNNHRLQIASELANLLVAAGVPGDTTRLDRAIGLFTEVLDRAEALDLRDPALLGRARAQLLLGDTTGAVAALDSLVARRQQSPVAPEAMLLRARIAADRGSVRPALGIYEEMEQIFFYSPFADSARSRKVSLLFDLGRYGDVVKLVPRLLPDESFGASLVAPDPGLLYLLAAAYDSLGQESKATEVYLRFARRFPGDPRRNGVLLALGRLAEERQAVRLARSYYEEILRIAPGSPEALRAQEALADLAFERELYDEARPRYLDLMKTATTAELRGKAAARAILCLYRQGQIEAADSEARSFRNQFPEAREQQAEFLYEKGEYYVRQKSFVRAERVFKSLSKEFKGTDYAALAELGLGRIYLITTKPDDALDVLTRLVERYPQTRAAALALLNLGDFYQANGQIENAITTLRKVVDHPRAGEAARTATRYLIQLYDQVNLNGQALALARQYVHDHPDDPQAENLQIKIGTLLMEERDYEGALAHFRRLRLQVKGEVETEVQYYIGEALMSQGRYQEAVLEFLKVEYLSPPSKLPWKVTALYQAGVALTRLKEYSRAKELFRRIVVTQGAASEFGRIAQSKIEEIDRLLAAAPEDSP